MQSVNRGVDFLVRVEIPKREANDTLALGPQCAVHERSAVGAGARRNPPPLHERVRDLGRIDIAHVKRNDRRAHGLVKRTVERNAGNVANAGEEALGKRTFACRNRLYPALGLDNVEARRKGRRYRDR